jgi:hypothetical protein
VPYQQNFGGHNVGDVGLRAALTTELFNAEVTAFKQLIDQFLEDGIEVVFVEAPEYLPGRNVPRYEELTQIIRDIAGERNIPFLNYNAERASAFNRDARNYSDWGHMNDRGAPAKLFSDLNEILDFAGTGRN